MADVKEIEQFDTDEDDFDTVMAEDINFSGSIFFEKPFMIKGSVDGSIDSKSDLLIDATAFDISAAQVVLEPGSAFSGKCTMKTSA